MERLLPNFLHLLRDTVPWFLLGGIAGAAIQAWLKPAWAMRWLGDGRGAVVTATVGGALLPGCALSTMPVAAALKQKGARLGTLTAFIMVAPILSPHTVALTAAMLGWKITLGRIVLPVALSLVVGWTLNAWESRRSGVRPPAGVGGGDGGPDADSPPDRFWPGLGKTFFALTPYLLAGLAVAAVLETVVPPDFMARHAQGGWAAYGVALAAGIPLYVCDGAEVPLTASLLQIGVGIGPAFTFLLSSVGTCLPTIAMAPRIIGGMATVIYVVAWLVLALGGGVLLAQLGPSP